MAGEDPRGDSVYSQVKLEFGSSPELYPFLSFAKHHLRSPDAANILISYCI